MQVTFLEKNNNKKDTITLKKEYQRKQKKPQKGKNMDKLKKYTKK